MARSATQNAINKVNVKGTLQQIVGWILVVMFGLCSVVGSTQIKAAIDVGMVIFCIAVTIGGIFIIISGTKKKRLIKTFRDYSSRLAADTKKSIDLLAASTGATVATVTENITEMINNGFFSNAYIDTGRNCLVFTDSQYQARNNEAYNQSPANSVSYITVQCKGCGATNKVLSGTIGECEFCGSQISGKQGDS